MSSSSIINRDAFPAVITSEFRPESDRIPASELNFRPGIADKVAKSQKAFVAELLEYLRLEETKTPEDK